MSKLYLKGETIFLYVKFLDNNNTSINIENPRVRILHTKNDNIYEDLPWSKLLPFSESEYYFNYIIPYDSDCGLYNVIYNGIINGNEASVIEEFHVINKSEVYSNAIKLYGYINSEINQVPLSNVNIEILNTNNMDYIQSCSMDNGYWESYLYPGEYVFSFKKDGFNDVNVNVQIGDENNEIQFNNISMTSKIVKTNGNGICKVTDKYILKNGIPLDGLVITVYSIHNPTKIIATNITNNEGVWEVFLDPGYYLLKVNGKSMNQEFNKTFRLKINDNSAYDMENMDNNKAIAQESILTEGNGSQVYRDSIVDKNGNPVIDVQVNILKNNIPIAQAYTDALGKYEFFLEPGNYTVDIYHPLFKDIPNFEITL